MDSGTVVLLIGIAIYSVFEYQRRERAHKEALEYLHRGTIPPEAPTRPSIQKIWTVGLVNLVLLPVTAIFINLALHGGKYRWPYLFLVVSFAALAVLLILILIRDIRAYRKG